MGTRYITPGIGYKEPFNKKGDMKEKIHLWMITYIYIYLFKGNMGIITHSRDATYAIIGQLMNGQFQEI